MKIDSRAVRLYLLGDERAVSAVYSAYFGFLYHGAYGILRNAEEAKDCVQEAFVDSLRNRPAVASPSALLSYLYKSSCNKAINCLKKSKRITGEEEGISLDKAPYGEELLNKLEAILLPQEYDALTLRSMGHPYKDIASVLDTTPGGARALYHRALGKAKKALKKEDWM